MDWKTMLAYVTGSVDEELLLRNEYLVAENRILRAQIPRRVKLTDGERRTLAQIGKQLGRKALAEVANIVRPDTILAWHRRLVARKFDGSKKRNYPGRPPVVRALEKLIVRLATENRDWGYDRIAGALANLGHAVSDQTVGNILKRHGIPTAPERRKTTTWKEFIRAHRDVLAATDFFTAEVWTLRGLVTYYVLFCMHVATRRVHIAGLTSFPNEAWMTQTARNLTMADEEFLVDHRYLIHDRDGKYCPAFDATLRDGGVTPVRRRWCKSLPPEPEWRSRHRWPFRRRVSHNSAVNSRVHPKYKTKYHVSNWPEYERALVGRGDVTLWLSAEAIQAWRPAPSGRPGGPRKFSNLAIETAKTEALLACNVLNRMTELGRPASYRIGH